MKYSIFRYIALLLLTTYLVSCDKDESVAEAPTVDAFLKADANLSMYVKAIDKANLESFKTGPGPFTWFAPTNGAFTAAGITEDSLNRMTQGQISYLLLY